MMTRFRKEFWLDDTKIDDRAVDETVETMKSQRAFAQSVKDGIMIVNELRQGKIDLLLKLYPWVADALKPSMPPPAPDNSKLERQIEQLQQVILSQGAGSPNGQVMQPVAGGLKPLKTNFVVKPPAPDDDDEMVVKRDENAGMKTTENFINSFMALQKAAPSSTKSPAAKGQGSRNLIENRA